MSSSRGLRNSYSTRLPMQHTTATAAHHCPCTTGHTRLLIHDCPFTTPPCTCAVRLSLRMRADNLCLKCCKLFAILGLQPSLLSLQWLCRQQPINRDISQNHDLKMSDAQIYSLFGAAGRGDLGEVRRLLKDKAKDVNVTKVSCVHHPELILLLGGVCLVCTANLYTITTVMMVEC